MAVTNTPIFPQAINLGIGQILTADAQAFKTIFTAGSNGSKVEAIFVQSTDSSARDITFNITRSATNYQISRAQIPANAGNTNAVIGFNLLGNAQVTGLPLDSNGNKYIYLKSGDTITVNAPVTLSTSSAITFFVNGGDY